jgi:hypothetical protein
MQMRQLIAALALAAGAAGCHETTAVPETVQADYALQSVNGSGLPTAVLTGGGNTYILLADTLRFYSTGRVFRHTVVRHLTTGVPSTEEVYDQHNDFPYQLAGTFVIIGYTGPCAANAICIGNESGLLTEDSVVTGGGLFWPQGSTFSFRRIPIEG